MIRDLLWSLFIKMISQGGKETMAMFFAQRVILGKSAFSDLPNGATNIVPATLETQVAEILFDSGLPELVPVRLGGTGVAA